MTSELSILLGLLAAAALHRKASRRSGPWAFALALLAASITCAAIQPDPLVGLVTLAALLTIALPLLAFGSPLWPRATWSLYSLALGAVAASWMGAL